MAVESFNSIASFAETQQRSNRRSHTLFEALQKEIVLGSLQPDQALTEMDLAQYFHCSQGTVREALMRLNEQGLVKRLPNRGTHVAPCNADDALALLHIRREVECTYLDRVVARADAQLDRDLHEMLNGMRNAARDGDEYTLSVWDRAFHTRLLVAAELPMVTPILTRCLIHNHRFKILNSTPNRELEATAERHVPILDALASRNIEALRSILAHHITTIVDFGPDLSDGDTTE